MGISRRQLYYIFEQHGGVMKFIGQRRLAACYGALVTLTEKRMISSIAYEYGFTNLSSFYRQFQARYGFSPGEARSAWLNGHTPRRTTGGSFADWLSRTDEA
jgi:AraC-like DNA-binding protein